MPLWMVPPSAGGNNSRGKLGDGSVTTFDDARNIVNNHNRMTPVQVSGLTSQVTAISAGAAHTCAIHGGAAKCWGLGGNGRLGSGGTADSSTPMAVTGLDSDVTAISAGASHTCAIHNGAAKCWGLNGKASWATTSTLAAMILWLWCKPLPMLALCCSQLDSQVTAISAGAAHTCAIHNGTAAKCWGLNEHGRLGDGSVTTFDKGSRDYR